MIDLDKTSSKLLVSRYDSTKKGAWNSFVQGAKNGHFLFLRHYMDYNADRFTDHSLLVHVGERLVALLPASRTDDVFVSHGGLTFGGIVSDARMRCAAMLGIFEAVLKHLRAAGITTFRYKALPHIYHLAPSEEDLYALFRNGANLVRRDLSSTIYLPEGVRLAKGRKWGINQSRKADLEVRESFDFVRFMEIEKRVLAEKYETQPVHTAEELEMLHNRFPNNIRLFGAYHFEEMVGGVIVYSTDTVAHLQYMAATQAGRDVCALDAVISTLQNDYYSDKRYFDFGISTERNGQYLNEDLAAYKESWGARSISYDTYEIQI
jgi:hypothetical protein